MAVGKKQLGDSPLLMALRDKRVSAAIVDLDHYRFGGGLAVETDFIIRVEQVGAPKTVNGFQFENFMLSKTYSAFRTLGNQLKKSADAVMNAGDPNLPKSVQKVAHYAETVVHLVDAQRTQYLGKVNYNYVKLLAKKRRQIIDEILEATLRYFPDETDSHPFLAEVAQTIETFFLLDHCEEADEATEVKNGVFKTPKKYSHRATPSGHHRVTPSGTITLTTSDDDDDQRLTSASSLPVPFNLNEAVESLGNMGEKLGTMVKQTLHVTDGTKTPSEKSRATPARIDTGVNPLSEKSISSPVVPYTRKPRRSSMMREHDDVELSEVGQEANLLLDDDRPPSEMVPSYSRPIPTFGSPGTRLGDILENNPVVFAVIFGLSVLFLRFSSKLTVTLDLDIELLLIFAAFCIGLHTPRPMVSGIDKTTGPSPTPLATSGVDLRSFLRKDPHGRMLLRKSMVATPDSSAQSVVTSFEGIAIPEEEPDAIIDENQSPMPRFPEGAALGSKLNCWSEPVPGNFQVRGAKYLSDKKKVPSSGFVFPVRGVDLFLTDACPENAGRISGVFGGNLRDLPTFMINFRLPWGILLAYFEIPEQFLPFVRAGYEPDFDKSKLPSLEKMSACDRCVARWLQGSNDHKNKTLKIVPSVVEGPWVVKSVVGGKPAIIGNKLPVNYVYQKAEKGKACYLEADLDIVASSAARGILSVARSYTQSLTIDLGFVVQGNAADELPEQMLIGARLHGIDPLNAPQLPPSQDMLMQGDSGDDDTASLS